MKRNLLLKTALALAIGSPLIASAESALATDGGSAVAHLDLNVVVPGVLYLGVGSGTDLFATGGNVDTISFDYMNNADQVGNGSQAANIYNTFNGYGSGIPVRVFGNNGQVTITATNPPNLVSGSNDTIPFSEMSVVSDNTNLPAPGFGGGTSQPVLAGRVTDRTATWTYSYANSTVPAAGSYVGRVTYTASML